MQPPKFLCARWQTQSVERTPGKIYPIFAIKFFADCHPKMQVLFADPSALQLALKSSPDSVL